MRTRFLQLSPFRGPHAQRAAFFLVSALVALAAARYVMQIEADYFPRPLVMLLAIAGGAILFTIAPESLFLGWLLVAPLLQSVPDGAQYQGMQLAFFVAPAAVLAVQTARRPTHLRLAWYDYLPGGFAVFVFVSMAVTTDLLSASPFSAFKAVFVTVALGPVAYYFIVFGASSSLTAERVARILLLACALQGGMSVVEWATGRNLWDDTGWRDGMARSVATLQNPAVLGAFIGAGMVLALAVLAWNGPRHLRPLSVVVLVLGAPGLAFTLTRGPILATTIVAAAVLVLGARSRVVGLVVIAACALLIVMAWPSITRTSIYNDRLSNTRNVQARVVIQDWSLKLARQKPILGFGYESFDQAKNSANFSAGALPVSLGLESTSHDTFLTILVEYGLVGMLLLLLPQVVILIKSVRRASVPSADRWLLVGGVAAVAVIALTGTTIDFRFFTFVPAVSWVFLGLLRRVVGSGDDAASAS